MEVKKVNAAGIKKAGSALRTVDRKIKTTDQKIKSGLTASVIGVDEETQEEQIKQNMTSSEWKSYQKLSERKKKKYRERDKEAEQAWAANAAGNRFGKNGFKRGAGGMAKSSGENTSSAAASAANNAVRAAGKAAKDAAGTGVKAASGAATGGISVGIAVVKKAAEQAKRTAKKIKADVETQTEGRKQAEKAQREKKQEAAEQEQTSDKSNKSTGAGSYLLTFVLIIMAIGGLSLFSLVMVSCPASKPKELRIVEVAKQELTDSGINIGGKKYKHWYGMDADWCAMFVSWCGNECGYIKEDIMPRTASVATEAQWYMKHELYQRQDSGYEPKPGDIIIFGKGISHTGIVIEYDPKSKKVTTIEGNTGTSYTDPYHRGSQVKKKSYPINYKYIVGYGTPDYSEDEEMETEVKEK